MKSKCNVGLSRRELAGQAPRRLPKQINLSGTQTFQIYQKNILSLTVFAQRENSHETCFVPGVMLFIQADDVVLKSNKNFPLSCPHADKICFIPLFIFICKLSFLVGLNPLAICFPHCAVSVCSQWAVEVQLLVMWCPLHGIL